MNCSTPGLPVHHQLPEFLSSIWLFESPWTVAGQAPLSMGFPRQEYWSGLPFPSPGDFPDPRITTLHRRQILYCLSPQGSPIKSHALRSLIPGHFSQCSTSAPPFQHKIPLCHRVTSIHYLWPRAAIPAREGPEGLRERQEATAEGWVSVPTVAGQSLWGAHRVLPGGSASHCRRLLQTRPCQSFPTRVSFLETCPVPAPPALNPWGSVRPMDMLHLLQVFQASGAHGSSQPGRDLI